MSLSVVSITLNIRNNRTYPQRINVLGSPVNPLDTANALTEYRYDITAFTPSSSDTLTLDYKPLGASVFSTYTYQLYNPNGEALVAALNGLGIGYFSYYIELGQTYLSTNNDDYVFGNLTINSNAPTPTTSTTTTTTTAASTSTTTTTTTAASTSTTTTTTTAASTSTTTTTTTAASTSTTTTTTTAAPTSTTTTTTTAAPTSTTTTTTTAAPTSTTTTTTTAAPTSTTTTTTTAAPTSTTTTTSSTTTTSTTTTTTTAATTTTTSSTTTTTTTPTCNIYIIEGAPSIDVQWLECDGTPNSATVTTAILICAQTGSVSQTGGAGNITQLGSCTSPTTTTTTTAAPTSTTTTTTTAAPTTSTTTTTTTAATTTSTTSTTTTLFQNLFFDLTTGVGGYTIGSIDVNSVTPTLTSGTNVPFNTDSHGFNTTQVGTNETLNIFVSAFILNGCITVTDSASNVFQQNITGTGTYSFAGLNIDNVTSVNVVCADNVC